MKPSLRMPSLVNFLLWYLPVLFVQVISSWITLSSLDPWYRELNKAEWNPPGWVFGPVWTSLYFLMAVSVWMVSSTDASLKERRIAQGIFFAQLIANGLWSFLFFGLQQPGYALIDLGLLILLVALMIPRFVLIRPLAGWLQLPYLFWLVYAFTLNAYIWKWN